jgi:ABC-type metal ion transport system substrate-binding protein
MTPHRRAANPDPRDIHSNRRALNFFNVHAAILPETVGNQKP